MVRNNSKKASRVGRRRGGISTAEIYMLSTYLPMTIGMHFALLCASRPFCSRFRYITRVCARCRPSEYDQLGPPIEVIRSLGKILRRLIYGWFHKCTLVGAPSKALRAFSCMLWNRGGARAILVTRFWGAKNMQHQPKHTPDESGTTAMKMEIVVPKCGLNPPPSPM